MYGLGFPVIDYIMSYLQSPTIQGKNMRPNKLIEVKYEYCGFCKRNYCFFSENLFLVKLHFIK